MGYGPGVFRLRRLVLSDVKHHPRAVLCCVLLCPPAAAVQSVSIHIPAVRELPPQDQAALRAAATVWHAAITAHGSKHALLRPPPEVSQQAEEPCFCACCCLGGKGRGGLSCLSGVGDGHTVVPGGVHKVLSAHMWLHACCRRDECVRGVQGVRARQLTAFLSLRTHDFVPLALTSPRLLLLLLLCPAVLLQVRPVLEAAIQAEGSSSEDTTDSAFERLHAPLLEEERVRLNPQGVYMDRV